MVPLFLAFYLVRVIIDRLGLQVIIVTARVPHAVFIEVDEQPHVVGSRNDVEELYDTVLHLRPLHDTLLSVEQFGHHLPARHAADRYHKGAESV